MSSCFAAKLLVAIVTKVTFTLVLVEVRSLADLKKLQVSADGSINYSFSEASLSLSPET